MMYFVSGVSNPDLTEIRALYVSSVSSEKGARKLEIITEKKNNSIIRGYNGASKMVMAKYYLNPVTKWRSFNEGREILETAINGDSTEPELRFIRLAIQKNIPSFLGYKNDQDRDKRFLENALFTIKDDELKKLIIDELK